MAEHHLGQPQLAQLRARADPDLVDRQRIEQRECQRHAAFQRALRAAQRQRAGLEQPQPRMLQHAQHLRHRAGDVEFDLGPRVVAERVEEARRAVARLDPRARDARAPELDLDVIEAEAHHALRAFQLRRGAQPMHGGVGDIERAGQRGQPRLGGP